MYGLSVLDASLILVRLFKIPEISCEFYLIASNDLETSILKPLVLYCNILNLIFLRLKEVSLIVLNMPLSNSKSDIVSASTVLLGD